jgi:uncharacterized protein (TIGR03437 family)
MFVSPAQVNAQMPFEAIGNVTMILRTPGGTSDNYNLQVLPGAPSVFRSAGPDANLPTIVRADDGLLVTDSHPIHRNDNEYLVIYLTGLGQTNPAVGNGLPAPVSPLAVALNVPTVTLGGVPLPVSYYGLTPGQVGVYQINVKVTPNVPKDWVTLEIKQGSSSTSLSVRVVN